MLTIVSLLAVLFAFVYKERVKLQIALTVVVMAFTLWAFEALPPDDYVGASVYWFFVLACAVMAAVDYAFCEIVGVSPAPILEEETVNGCQERKV